MTRADLKGVYTATITPVNQDRSLDTGAVKALVDYYVDSGLKGALVPSSSGEYFSMTADMKRHFAAEAVKASAGRFQILGNISDDCPEVILHNARVMADVGCDAVVCQPPQFHGYSQEECIDLFNYVADNSPLPVIIYDHLLRLPTRPTVETVIEMCKHENIIGIKDTHRDNERPFQLKAAMKEAGVDFAVLLGGDMTVASGCLAGCDLLNALSAIRPDLMVGAWEAAQVGEVDTVNANQAKVGKLCKIFDCLRGGKSSSTLFAMALKIALEKKGLCGTQSVILGFEANDEDRAAVEAVLASVDAD